MRQPHNDRAQNGTRERNEGGGRDQMKAGDDGDDDGARGGIERARAFLRRARGTDGRSEERELGHDLTARPRQPPGRRDGGGGETFHL